MRSVRKLGFHTLMNARSSQATRNQSVTYRQLSTSGNLATAPGTANTRASSGCRNRGKYAVSSALPTGIPPAVLPCFRPMGEMDQ
jgi:hypothetical protein